MKKAQYSKGIKIINYGESKLIFNEFNFFSFQRIINDQIEGAEYKKIFGKFECMICKVEIKRWYNFRMHCLRQHSQQENDVFCPLCQKLFPNEDYVQRHVYRFHHQTMTRNEIRESQSTSNNLNGLSKDDVDIAIDIKAENLNDCSEPIQEDNGNIIAKEELEENDPVPNNHCKNVFCTQCFKAYTSVQHVQRHLLQTHDQRVSSEAIEKAQINITQSQKDSHKANEMILNKHYTKVDGKFQCLICSREVAKLCRFRDHYFTHVRGKHLFCPQCFKAYTSVRHVQRHLMQAHNQRMHSKAIRKAQMNITQSQRDNPSDYTHGEFIPNIHYKKVNGRFECLKCFHSTREFRYFKEHYYRHGKRNIFCPLCLKSFFSVRHAQRHCYNAHKQRINSEEVEKVQKNKKFECFQCHRQKNSMESLIHHMGLHTHTNFIF